ncbi:MAG: hypothetical protein AAB394_01185 [Patescibacteria group bacterium]
MTTEVAPKDKAVSIGMEVVLNGGKKEMDSATIPIQWVFSIEGFVGGEILGLTKLYLNGYNGLTVL